MLAAGEADLPVLFKNNLNSMLAYSLTSTLGG